MSFGCLAGGSQVLDRLYLGSSATRVERLGKSLYCKLEGLKLMFFGFPPQFCTEFKWFFID